LSEESRFSGSALSSFGELVLESEDLYPGIDRWFDRKVLPGIKDGSRIAYIVFHHGKAIAESIVKFGSDTKICSMRVDPIYQGKGLGPFLFAQLARELDSSVRHVHFTAPESLVVERKGLFDDLGFSLLGRSRENYRSGQDELVFRGSASQFRRQSLSLVSKKITRNFVGGSIPGILMSIRAQYVDMILAGEKSIEVRRRFSEEHKGSIALLYATKPVGQVLGDALIADVISDYPQKIWKEFHHQIGASKEEYDSYCAGDEKVNAIFLSHVSKYPHPFNWSSVIESFTGIQRPPQSYQKIPIATLSFWGSLSFPEQKKKNLVEASIGF
jgi:predicted transcriptional regulator/GNAT superfamily N-acetyltransferase